MIIYFILYGQATRSYKNAHVTKLLINYSESTFVIIVTCMHCPALVAAQFCSFSMRRSSCMASISMLRYAMASISLLRYAMASNSMLRYAMASISMLRYAIASISMLRYAMACISMLRYTMASSSMLRYAMASISMLRYASDQHTSGFNVP